MNTTKTSKHQGEPDFSDTDLEIARLRKKYNERRLNRAGGEVYSDTVSTGVQGLINEALSDSGVGEIYQEVDIDFDRLANDNRTVEELFRDLEIQESPIQTIDRNKLRRGKTRIAVSSLDGEEHLTLTFARVSGAFDRVTKQLFLKFKDENHEFIWNGVLRGRKAVWGKRDKNSGKGYDQIRRFETQEIDYEG